MQIKVAIFDWDGTIVDSVDHIASSLLKAALDVQLPALEHQAYRNIIGLGMVDALQTLYPDIDKEAMLAMREAYGRHFFSRRASPAQIFEGMTRVLTDLQKAGLGCAVATGKSRRGLDLALQSTGLASHFEFTRCADETRSKPDPAMLLAILQYYGIEPGEAVMIGDTTYDMEMARRIDMHSIAVEWGVHKAEQLQQHRPTAIVSTVADLRRELRLGNALTAA